jgi:hypothetical protein
MKTERRQNQHDTSMIVYSVIGSARVVAYLTYGSLCLGFVISLGYALMTKDFTMPILVTLAATLGNAGGQAMGFIGGVLSTTGNKPPQPVTVENAANDPVPTVVADAPLVADDAPDDEQPQDDGQTAPVRKTNAKQKVSR